MNIKDKRCVLTIAVSEEEKSVFIAMARDLNVSCNALMRRLARYLLDRKISWAELFGQSKEFLTENARRKFQKRHMRTYLDPEHYATLAQLTEEWGSTTAVVLRRMIQLYIAGKIERRDIW